MRSFCSTTSAMFFEYGQFLLWIAVPSHNDHLSIFQQHCCLHTAEPSVLLHECGWMCRRANHSRFFTFSFPFLVVSNSGPVHCRMFDTSQSKSDKICLIFNSLASHLLVHSSLPAHSVATLSQTHPRLCQPRTCFHLVWLYGSFFISIACVDCHHFVLLYLNTCSTVLTVTCPSHRQLFQIELAASSVSISFLKFSPSLCSILSRSHLLSFRFGTNASWPLFLIP